jgi:hypothetical protein
VRPYDNPLCLCLALALFTHPFSPTGTAAPLVKRLTRPKQLKEQLQQQPDTDNCRVFVDRDGDMIRVMCCDYGFRTGSGRLYQDAYGEVPADVFTMVSTMQQLCLTDSSCRAGQRAAAVQGRLWCWHGLVACRVTVLHGSFG